MQRGLLIKKSGAWYVRFYTTRIGADGRPEKYRASKRLGSLAEYDRRDAQLLADKLLAPLNAGAVTPESAMRVADFIEQHYLPHVKRELRPSTYHYYSKGCFEAYIKSRLGNLTLRDARVVHFQRLLRDIPGVSHRTLQHQKSFLSGVFKFARRSGVLDTPNPLIDVSVPGRPSKFKGPAYSLEEIEDALGCLGEPARSVVATAAFSGLRVSELQGLEWTDYDGETLNVRRARWRTRMTAPKSEASEASVPVLPFLKKVLDRHRAAHPNTTYIFQGERRRSVPINMANLARRVIMPKFKEKGIPWKGWHGFRRGLSSNLYTLGVLPKVIQAVLRHSDISTTLALYVQTPDAESRAALQQLEDSLWI